MATEYAFVDDSGTTRLEGFLVPEPGGSQPVTHGQYAGNAVSVANNASGDLTINTLQAGDALLDLTTPTAPIVVAAGVYAFTAHGSVLSDMTEGGLWSLGLELDADGDDQGVSVSLVAAATLLQPPALIPFTYYVPAGGTLRIQATNLDGSLSHNFSCGLFVQRLSGPA